jgi:hypothetical protein
MTMTMTLAYTQKILNDKLIQKRPHIRTRNPPEPPLYKGAPVHKVVRDIISPAVVFDHTRRPIICQERTSEYFRLLKRNNEYYDIPFTTPDVRELTVVNKPVIIPEKYIDYLDQVQVTLCILKSGRVNVKFVFDAALLYEKYYSQIKQPPLEELMIAYKNLGYSSEFVQSFVNKHTKRLAFCAKVNLDKIFAKPKRQKRNGPPKAKKVPVADGEEEIVADVEEVEIEEEGDVPEEDEAIVDDDEDVDNDEAGEDGMLDDYE